MSRNAAIHRKAAIYLHEQFTSSSAPNLALSITVERDFGVIVSFLGAHIENACVELVCARVDKEERSAFGVDKFLCEVLRTCAFVQGGDNSFKKHHNLNNDCVNRGNILEHALCHSQQEVILTSLQTQ